VNEAGGREQGGGGSRVWRHLIHRNFGTSVGHSLRQQHYVSQRATSCSSLRDHDITDVLQQQRALSRDMP